MTLHEVPDFVLESTPDRVFSWFFRESKNTFRCSRHPIQEKYGEINDENRNDYYPDIPVIPAHVLKIFAVSINNADDKYHHENACENEMTLCDVFHDNVNAQIYCEYVVNVNECPINSKHGISLAKYGSGGGRFA